MPGHSALSPSRTGLPSARLQPGPLDCSPTDYYRRALRDTPRVRFCGEGDQHPNPAPTSCPASLRGVPMLTSGGEAAEFSDTLVLPDPFKCPPQVRTVGTAHPCLQLSENWRDPLLLLDEGSRLPPGRE